VVDLKQMGYWGTLNAQFSALYGKMELYDYLVDYDFYVAGGFGLVTTLETCVLDKSDPSCVDKDYGIGRGIRAPEASSDRYKIAGSLGGGLRFFFRDWLGLRIEVRDLSYPERAEDAGEVTTDIRNHVLFMVGASFLL